MIAVDSSALVAIAKREDDWMNHLAALQSADAAMISAVNYVEVGILLRRHDLIEDQARLDAWLDALGIKVREDLPLADVALTAYLTYGKGFHPAGLNLADVFAYALAKTLNAPLLYKGDDFVRTDIRSALQPI